MFRFEGLVLVEAIAVVLIFGLEGHRAEPHNHNRRQGERQLTNQFDFSWSTWLAAWLTDVWFSVQCIEMHKNHNAWRSLHD